MTRPSDGKGGHGDDHRTDHGRVARLGVRRQRDRPRRAWLRGGRVLPRGDRGPLPPHQRHRRPGLRVHLRRALAGRGGRQPPLPHAHGGAAPGRRCTSERHAHRELEQRVERLRRSGAAHPRGLRRRLHVGRRHRAEGGRRRLPLRRAHGTAVVGRRRGTDRSRSPTTTSPTTSSRRREPRSGRNGRQAASIRSRASPSSGCWRPVSRSRPSACSPTTTRSNRSSGCSTRSSSS